MADIIPSMRWRMHINTWLQRLDLEVNQPTWNKVYFVMNRQRYFLGHPIVFDNTMALGMICLEPNPETKAAAERAATSQA